MNKSLYRLVFNASRGQVMAVSETSTASGKSASGETRSTTAATASASNAASALMEWAQAASKTIAIKPAALAAALFTLGLSLSVSVGGAAFAQTATVITADRSAPGSQQATVLPAANGVTQVNIQAPSASGVSRNVYTQFDVGSQGVILNNSYKNVQTNLAGWIQANPWLATGGARIILNEVNSSNPSQLRGFVEVAGQRAQVIIANPSGIAVNGGGFINASGVTLTTGTPQFNGASLDSYRVQRGMVTIDGAGLDTSGADYTQILARAVQANAGVWAKDLTVVTGANTVAASNPASTTNASAITGTGPAPAFALDVAALGGMYAGKIVLIGTEAGLGVNNAGTLATSSGELVLQANGMLTNTARLEAKGDLQIQAQGVNNPGTIYSAANATVSAEQDIHNSGTLAAAGNTTLQTQRADSRISSTTGSTLAAGLQANNTLSGNGQLQVQAAQSITVQGTVLAAGHAQLQAQQIDITAASLQAQSAALQATQGDLEATDANVQVQGLLSLQTPQTLNTNNATVSAGQLQIHANDIDNINGLLQQTGTADLNITLPGYWDNTKGRFIANSQHLTIEVQGITNDDGAIRSAGDINLSAQDLINWGHASYNRYGSDDYFSEANPDADKGIQGRNVTLNVARLSHEATAVRASEDLTINASESIEGRWGVLSAGRDVRIQQASVSDGLSVFSESGLIEAGRDIAIQVDSGNNYGSGRIDLRDNTVQAQRDISLVASNSQNLQASLVDAHYNTIQALGNINVQADYIDTASTIQAGQDITFTARNTIYNGYDEGPTGSLEATNITLQAQEAVNNITLISASNTVRISTPYLRNERAGSIFGDYVSIESQELANTGLDYGQTPIIGARKRLDLGVQTLTNDWGAELISLGDLYIGGALDADGHATGRAELVSNNGGRIEATTAVDIRSKTIDNNNPDFQWSTVDQEGVSGIDYFTSAGTFSSVDGAWLQTTGGLIPENHGGYIYLINGSGSKGRVVPSTSPYAGSVFQGAYFAANPVQTLSGEPLRITATPSADVWAAFGLSVPSTTPPAGDRPDASDIAGRAAWDAAAAPWVELTQKINTMRSTVDATAITIDAFRTYTQTDRLIQVDGTKPGQIISAGTIKLEASESLTNYQSRIIAGGDLQITGAQVANNTAVLDTADVRDGISYNWDKFDHGCGSSKGCDYLYFAYRDKVESQNLPKTLSLDMSEIRKFTAPASSVALPPGSAAPTVGSVVLDGNIGSIVTPPTVALPSSSLFSITTNPSASYLIETDAHFTNQRNWLGSDYLLRSLSTDGSFVQKRLGDGYYEQRLINEQVAQLTGRRFLGDYTSDEAQYLGLMNAGITFARAHQLVPGIALSAEQVAQLTSDIVWLVEKEVTLQDGSTQKVLVPQIYALVREGDIANTGALLSGNSVHINTTGDLTNSGTILGRNLVAINAQTIHNLGGQMQSDVVALDARQDINIQGGSISAQSVLSANAGRDIIVQSTLTPEQNTANNTPSSSDAKAISALMGGFASAPQNTPGSEIRRIDRLAGLYVTSSDGILLANAARDIKLLGATVQSAGDAQLLAGNNLELGTVQTSQTERFVVGDNRQTYTRTQDHGSTITSAANLDLQAGNTITSRAATVEAGQALSANATNIVLLAGQDTNSADQVYVSKSSDILTTTTTATHHTSISATAQISTFTGQSVDIQASNALISQGSEFTATDGKLRVKGQDTSAFYEAQNISQSSTTTESTTSLSGLGSMLVMGLPVDLKIDDHSSTDAQASSIALGSVLQSNQAIEVDVGRKATFNGSKLIAPDIIFNNANGSQPGELVLGISTNTTQTSHTERTETAGVYQDMQGSGQTVQTANATLLKGQVSWGDGIHITVEKPVVKTTDSSPGAMQGKGLMGFAIADTANSLVENNPTASGYPSGNTSGKAAIPEQSSRTSLAQSLATLPENMTGLEYLDQLKARKDVNWQAVELAHDRWSYHQEGLTPAGAALVSIAVAMATGGSASGLTAGLTNSVSVNTALAAGLTSLSSQAAVALINNQGDIGKTLDQLGQEKSIQNLVTAMVTAGALDKLGKSDWLTFDGHKLSEIGLQPGQVQDFSANLFKNAVNATSSAAVSAMVSGKPFDENSLADALGSALVTTSTAFGAKGIGDAKDSGDLNTFTHKLAHAVLGCAGGAATQGSMDGCSPGAVGAVVGELAAEYYNPSGNPAKAAETVNFAKLMSALAGVIATGDGSNAQAVNTAAAMGANAAENNYLSHIRPSMLRLSEKEKYENAVAACDKGDQSSCKTKTELATLSKERDRALQAACTNGLSPECLAATNEAISMGNQVFRIPGTNFVYANSPELGAIRGLNTQMLSPVEIKKVSSDALEKTLGQNLADSLVITALASPPGLVASTGLASFNATTNLQNGEYGAAAYNVGEAGVNILLAGAPRIASLVGNELKTAIGVELARDLRPLTPMEGLSAPVKTGNVVLDAPVLANADGSTIWVPAVKERGALGEELLSRNTRGIGLHNNEPVIDVFVVQDGQAVSMKTLDWNTDAKITNPGSVESAIRKQVRDLANYEGTAKLVGDNTQRISSEQIKTKTLELILPATGGTQAQVAAVNRAIAYAKQNGVSVKIFRAK